MTDTALVSAAPYADIDLEVAVRAAIGSVDSLRGSRSEVNVQVINGHVVLTGYVQTPMQATEAGRAAHYVPGVLSVANEVCDDASLRRRVAEALATDARTRHIPPGYMVNSAFGHILFIGHVSDEDAAALTAVALAVPCVRNINLRVID
jgi:hypothetical protein